MRMLTVMMLIMTSAVASAAPLAGQAGSDTTSRAMAPQQVHQSKPTPEAEPEKVEAKPAAIDAVKIGVIDKLTLVGPQLFLKVENVQALLEKPLCDGKEKTVGELRAALAAAKKELVSRGYYLVEIVPSRGDAYQPESKALELSVEPGRFGDIKFTMKNNEGKGDWYYVDQVEKRFKFVKSGEPFNYNTFRQALRLLNGHPDLLADTKIKVRKVAVDEGVTNEVAATTGYIYLDADIEVEDSLPFHATLDVNNYAMQELGYWQMLMTLQYLNVSGADDVLTVSPGVTFNGEMWSIATSYMRPFDLLLGGSWSIYGGYSDMNCDAIVERMNLEGIGGFAGFNTQWNLYDTERRNVSFNFGVMWRLLRDQWEMQWSPMTRRDLHIIPLTAGFSYSDKRRDRLGGLDFASVSETANIYGDAALFNRYSEEANPNYCVLRASWARLQPIYGPEADGEEWRCWSLFQKFEGQWAQGNTLITAERLAYGGFNCLRGYRSRGYLGDSGIYGTTEFRTPVFCNPVTQLFFDGQESVLERFQFVLFTDYGWLSNTKVETSRNTKDEFLWSAGFGVRAAITQYLSVNFDFAVPLRDCYAKDKDRNLELYFSIKMQY